MVKDFGFDFLRRHPKMWQQSRRFTLCFSVSNNTANAIVKRNASGNFSAGVITAADENLSDVLSITSAATNPIFASTSASTGVTAVYEAATVLVVAIMAGAVLPSTPSSWTCR